MTSILCKIKLPDTYNQFSSRMLIHESMTQEPATLINQGVDMISMKRGKAILFNDSPRNALTPFGTSWCVCVFLKYHTFHSEIRLFLRLCCVVILAACFRYGSRDAYWICGIFLCVSLWLASLCPTVLMIKTHHISRERMGHFNMTIE